MNHRLQFLFLVVYQLFVCYNANAQFNSTIACLGGSNDDQLYPQFQNIVNSNYSFKTKDGGSIYFGSSNSADGTFAPDRGYNDLVVIKIAASGNLEYTKNFGNSFYEHNFIVTQSSDSSRFFILMEGYSNDSFYTNDYTGNIIIRHNLLCIDQHGNELWNKLLRSEVYNKLDRDYFPSPHYENQINLFTDKQDNNLTFFEKVRFDTVVHQYIIDSIFYTKTDKNGNIQWMNAITPFSIYNNSSTLQIDTFYNYSFRTDNNFVTLNGKYFLSAYLSNNSEYASALYSLNDNDGTIASVKIIDSFYYFKMLQAPNSLIIYGNKSVYVADSVNTYAALFYRKYDSGLNPVYEDYIPYYNDVPTNSHWVSFNVAPFFNSDSSKIWFNSYVNISDVTFYFGIIISIQTKILTYANIINQQNGTLLSQIDLNKKELNFFTYKLNDKFYYVSTNNSPDSISGSVITTYNFDGSTTMEKQFDSINFELGSSGFTNSAAGYNLFSNIPSSFVTTFSDSGNTKKFFVFDTASTITMKGNFDNLIDNYFGKCNLHVIDTNTYSLINNIYTDTISGCYPNTNNIIFRKFSRISIPTALIKNKNSETKLSVFPNPNNGNFTIDFTAKGNYSIMVTLYDVTGKVVYKEVLQHNNQSVIPISDAVLPSGLYNIQISSEQDVWNKKVIITR